MCTASDNSVSGEEAFSEEIDKNVSKNTPPMFCFISPNCLVTAGSNLLRFHAQTFAGEKKASVPVAASGYVVLHEFVLNN